MKALRRLGADSVKQLSSSVVYRRDLCVPKVTCSKDMQLQVLVGTTATHSPWVLDLSLKAARDSLLTTPNTDDVWIRQDWE